MIGAVRDVYSRARMECQRCGTPIPGPVTRDVICPDCGAIVSPPPPPPPEPPPPEPPPTGDRPTPRASRWRRRLRIGWQEPDTGRRILALIVVAAIVFVYFLFARG